MAQTYVKTKNGTASSSSTHMNDCHSLQVSEKTLKISLGTYTYQSEMIKYY